MKRMLINATQPEELRVALVDGQRLYDLDIDSSSRTQKKSNIYKGRVVRVEKSLEAAFIDYGGNRHGFLPFRDISPSLFSEEEVVADSKEQQPPKQQPKPDLKFLLKEGQEFIIQIEKEERGNKGAALTTLISLAGRYLVLIPYSNNSTGISRQVEGSDREEAKKTMSQLNLPKGLGMIMRTAGVGKNTEELQWDLDHLIQIWHSISKIAKEKPAPFLIYQEKESSIRVIRDYLTRDINEIWVDNPKTFERIHEFMQQIMPHRLEKLKLYKDAEPLFSHYHIESQIETAFSRKIHLPSGGSLVIDHTEALTSIDINSAKATAGSDIEETACVTNLEAVEEIAKQIRLRDLGGLIVIDFIDMIKSKNKQNVENKLKEAIQIDRARVQIGWISRFGLLEMSRQRLRPSLGESSHTRCPRCEGQGFVRDVESLSLSILRMIEETATKDLTAQVIAKLPIETATFLLNEKRQILNDIEYRHDMKITIVPISTMETPQYNIERVSLVNKNSSEKKANYLLPNDIKDKKTESFISKLLTNKKPSREIAAVQEVMPEKPIPIRGQQFWFTKAINTLLGWFKKTPPNKNRRRYKYASKKPQRNRRNYRAKSGTNRGAPNQRYKQNSYAMKNQNPDNKSAPASNKLDESKVSSNSRFAEDLD